MVKRLRLAKQTNQLPTAHETPLPRNSVSQQVDEAQSQPGRSLLYHQPFSPTDLLNWKHHNPAYSDKPLAMTDLLGSIFPHTTSAHMG